MTTESSQTTRRLGDPLHERAKELRCLYNVSDVMQNPELSLEEIFRGVIDAVPNGWQHSEVCRVRITFGDDVHQSAGYEQTPWAQRANIFVRGKPAGSIDVVYLENRSELHADAFLLEERKLIDTIARWLGRSIEARHAEATAEGGVPPGQRGLRPKPEWEIILDLLKDTDAMLWRRILRRLMNHLSTLGVPGVQQLIPQFDPATYAERERDSRGANQPTPRQDAESVSRLFDEIIRLASIALAGQDLTVLLKHWMRQDRMGFLSVATEQSDHSLVQFSELLDRFCRSAKEGEPALAPSDELNVRVALARRFLSDRLSFVGTAKEYISIHDYGRMLGRVVGPPQGDGKLGGKTAGLFLAEHILRKKGKGSPLIERVRVPHAWCVTSDGLFEFVRYNSLEDTLSLKYNSTEQVRHGYPYLEQMFKHSFFPPEMLMGLKVALDDLGDWPLIVRSSSLLEDSEGSAFSGKYRSLFLVNSGTKDQRLAALVDAIAEVYASVFGPDPIQYRKERGLVDFMEQMAILIQRVVGTRVGRYFLPAFAGVAFTQQRIPLVTSDSAAGRDDPHRRGPGDAGRRSRRRGLPRAHLPWTAGVARQRQPRGHAPLLAALRGCPQSGDGADSSRRASRSCFARSAADCRWSTRWSRSIRTALCGDRSACWRTRNPTRWSSRLSGSSRPRSSCLRSREVMRVLQDALGMPVDIEFAHDGSDLYILQCRPQTSVGDERRMPVPLGIPAGRRLFSASRYVSNAQVSGIRYVVYIDPLDVWTAADEKRHGRRR